MILKGCGRSPNTPAIFKPVWTKHWVIYCREQCSYLYRTFSHAQHVHSQCPHLQSHMPACVHTHAGKDGVSVLRKLWFKLFSFFLQMNLSAHNGLIVLHVSILYTFCATHSDFWTIKREDTFEAHPVLIF